jgi:Transposase DDE domain group 1
MMQKGWRPKRIRLVATRERLSQASGLGTMIELFDQSQLAREFERCLPRRKSPRSFGSYRLGLVQIASFLYGHDCLDDLLEFQEDPFLNELMEGETPAARTMGDFLRDFDDSHLVLLNEFLAKMSYRIRTQMIAVLPEEYKPSEAPIMDIDSTDHVQSGEKMEGLAWNYKNHWCLDSQVVFDEMGICAGFNLRPGNTKSGVDGPAQIRNAFRYWRKDEEKYLRADSAYCYEEVFRTCLDLRSYFTITANQATTGWENHIEEIVNWKVWEYTDKEKLKAAEQEKVLPTIESGSFLWAPSWAANIRLTIIVKRTWVVDKENSQGKWDYYGVVAGMPQEFTMQRIIEHHQKRGHSENFIRDEKYGYDLKHFPCQKLKANYAYGLLGMVAHNILRWCAVIEKPDKPHFSKKLRRRFIYIPGKVVHHARQLFVKIPERFFREVNRLRQGWQLPLHPAPAWATG